MKHIVALFTVALLVGAAPAAAQVSQLFKNVWACYSPGDNGEPVALLGASDAPARLDKDGNWKWDNGGIAMNGVYQPASHTMEEDGAQTWRIPTVLFQVDDAGKVDTSVSNKEAIDRFVIDANGVGKYYAQDEIRFTVECKRQQ